MRNTAKTVHIWRSVAVPSTGQTTPSAASFAFVWAPPTCYLSTKSLESCNTMAKGEGKPECSVFTLHSVSDPRHRLRSKGNWDHGGGSKVLNLPTIQTLIGMFNICTEKIYNDKQNWILEGCWLECGGDSGGRSGRLVAQSSAPPGHVSKRPEFPPRHPSECECVHDRKAFKGIE